MPTFKLKYENEKTYVSDKYNIKSSEKITQMNDNEILKRNNTLEYTQNSYEQFKISFIKHFDDHIESLKIYKGNKRIGIF